MSQGRRKKDLSRPWGHSYKPGETERTLDYICSRCNEDLLPRQIVGYSNELPAPSDGLTPAIGIVIYECSKCGKESWGHFKLLYTNIANQCPCWPEEPAEEI